MATQMNENPGMGTDETQRPVVWPWVVLAIVVALALWWAAANNANRNAMSNSQVGSSPGVTSPATPGSTGYGGTGAGAGSGDMTGGTAGTGTTPGAAGTGTTGGTR